MPDFLAPDFIAQKCGTRFAISPCSMRALLYTHRVFFSNRATYGGEPVWFEDCDGILEAIALVRDAGLLVEYIPANLTVC